MRVESQVTLDERTLRFNSGEIQVVSNFLKVEVE